MTIEPRDALIYMLTEAAELEHAIMCRYLYAAFSLKTSTDEGSDERQLRAITGWKKTIYSPMRTRRGFCCTNGCSNSMATSCNRSNWARLSLSVRSVTRCSS